MPDYGTPNATIADRTEALEAHLIRLRAIDADLVRRAEFNEDQTRWGQETDDVAAKIEVMRDTIKSFSDDLATALKNLRAVTTTSFALAGDTTTITHGLGFFPLVRVLNSVGEDITEAGFSIRHVNLNDVRVSGAGAGFVGTLVIT